MPLSAAQNRIGIDQCTDRAARHRQFFGVQVIMPNSVGVTSAGAYINSNKRAEITR